MSECEEKKVLSWAESNLKSGGDFIEYSENGSPRGLK